MAERPDEVDGREGQEGLEGREGLDGQEPVEGQESLERNAGLEGQDGREGQEGVPGQERQSGADEGELQRGGEQQTGDDADHSRSANASGDAVGDTGDAPTTETADATDAAAGETADDVDTVDTEGTDSDAMSEIVAALDAAEAEEEFERPAAELKAIVEALIFASPDPLTPKALLKLLDNEPKEEVLAALEGLKQDYERPGGLQLVEVAGGFQIVTRPDLHEWVRRLFHERSTQKLSVAALETLAVIAYRQPITAIEITEIRGVNTSGVLNTLLERHLIKIVGRKQVVGRPFMYGTTKEFLVRFGLKDLTDLPKVEDMAESLGIESTLLVERTPPEEQLPLSEPDADPLSPIEPVDDTDHPDDEPSVH